MMAYISKVNLNGDLYLLKDEEARTSVGKLTPVIATATLAAASWSNASYSFESTYPVATYNLVIELNGDTCTAAQREAWDSAAIQGSPTTNKIKAFGDVPTVDLPIVIYHTKK